MYAITLSLLIALITGIGFWKIEISTPGWAIVWGFAALIASAAVITLVIRKRITRIMNAMQTLLADGQKKIQARVNAFQRKPTGDPKRLMNEVEATQKKLIADALEITDQLEPYRKWTPLFGRQLNTTRMQFHYQMKAFKKVDELLPKCLIIDPMSAAMKIARLYETKAPLEDITKAFHKARARTKYNQSALLYALMAWIYVKNGEPEQAHTLLVEGCEKNENETLKRNRDRLANNKVREFSNANFGEEWFALYLEQPKMQVRRQMPRADGRPF